MSDKKDYLSALASEVENKKKGLESFQEEKVERIEKPKFNFDKRWILAIILAVVILGLASWFFFFAPKISMPNFVGKTQNDVSVWAKQNSYDRNAIAFVEEFSLEYDSGVVMNQTVEEGKKIKETTPITFTLSKGADPDEKIDFPDILNMTAGEIDEWKAENKLSKVKVNTEYSTTVAKDNVISYDLRSVNENNFTRGTNLTIVISKGPQPAGTVTLEDFTNKTYEEVVTWANQKKVTLEKTEAYSDTVDIGKVISQSVKSGQTMQQGEILSVVVSKGKAVKIPNLVGYDKEMLEAWKANKDNAVTIIEKKRYNEALEGTVIGQNIQAGTQVDQGTVLELTISLYMPILETESSNQWFGKDFIALNNWVDEVNGQGGNIQAGAWDGEMCSDEYPTAGQIWDLRCLDINGNELPHGCSRPLPLDARIAYKKSTGACTVKAPEATPEAVVIDYTGWDFDKLSAVAVANGINISSYETVDDAQANNFKVYKSDGTEVTDNKLHSGQSYIVERFIKSTNP